MAAQSLKEIEKEIDKLQKQAAELRARDKQKALTQVLDLLEQYEIGADDLGFELKFSSRQKIRKPAKAKTVAYRNGDLTWSGGRGAKPKWVKEVLEKSGPEGLEKYRA